MFTRFIENTTNLSLFLTQKMIRNILRAKLAFFKDFTLKTWNNVRFFQNFFENICARRSVYHRAHTYLQILGEFRIFAKDGLAAFSFQTHIMGTVLVKEIQQQNYVFTWQLSRVTVHLGFAVRQMVGTNGMKSPCLLQESRTSRRFLWTFLWSRFTGILHSANILVSSPQRLETGGP